MSIISAFAGILSLHADRNFKVLSTPVATRAQSPVTANPSLVPHSAGAHDRHSNSQTSIISISSTRSSDIEELSTSQPVTGEVWWVGRSQDALDINLLTCLTTGFPSALINPTLRSTTFGTEEMCLHCIPCVAFDDKRASLRQCRE